MSQEDNVLVAPQDAPEEAQPSKKARRGPVPLSDEEREARAAQKDAIANNKRWQLLVRSSGTFAVWDDFNGSIIAVYHEKKDALNLLTKLREGHAVY